MGRVRLAPLPKRLCDLLASERVQGLSLLGCRGQAQLVRLPVDGDEALGYRPQDGRGHAPSADERARPAGSGHLPSHDDFCLPAVDVVGPSGVVDRRQNGGIVGDEERPLDPRRLGAGADVSGVRLSAQDELQRREGHRLSRAGLAGQGREPRRKVEPGLGDDPEVLYGQRLNH